MLLDHYDNCASGGTMDTTAVLAAILREGLENVAAFAIYDPEAVQQAIAAGIGAEVALAIGGKIPMPAIPGDSRPLAVTGVVKTISNGRFRNKGPMGRGVQMDMGPSVVLDTGRVEIALISRHVEPNDLNCLVVARHRPDAEALRDAEKPHPLARRSRLAGEIGRRMRRDRGLHLGLQPVDLQERAPADLPARPAEPLTSRTLPKGDTA